MISNESQRIFLDDSGVMKDFSIELNDYRDGTVSLALNSVDNLYIGQYLPFTSRYFDITTANATAATLNVEYWSGAEWIQAVDIIDETATNGVTFSKDGYLSWKISRDSTTWGRQCKSQNITELSTAPQVYDFYWVRITTDTTIDSINYNYVGNLFSVDNAMYSWYPNLNNQITRDQWDTGAPGTKADWQEQGYMASEYIVTDLKTRNIILEEGQILDRAVFNASNLHKQASIIYGGLLRGYEDDRVLAESRYQDAMDLGRKNIDRCADGDLDGTDRAYAAEMGVR